MSAVGTTTVRAGQPWTQDGTQEASCEQVRLMGDPTGWTVVKVLIDVGVCVDIGDNMPGRAPEVGVPAVSTVEVGCCVFRGRMSAAG
mmetsp:Transcript_9569/g.21346  ORF Transcript_9569/g.21346 Transcript_9569/m.21346 type:complete len:87 (+) Transcript_9569:1007-1267(+)